MKEQKTPLEYLKKHEGILPKTVGLAILCRLMEEYSYQQNAELRESVKELEDVCEYALKVIKAVNSPFGATKPIIERIEKALKK